MRIIKKLLHMVLLGLLEVYLKLNKDSNSINIYNQRIALFLKRNKVNLFLIIMSIFKMERLNGNLLLLKNGNLLPKKVSNSLNFYFLQQTLGEQTFQLTLFQINLNLFTQVQHSNKMVFYQLVDQEQPKHHQY